MEKRLFAFIVLSLLIWGSFLGLNYWLNPPKINPDIAKKTPAEQRLTGEKAAEKAGKKEAGQGDATSASKEKKPAEEESPPVRRTLGSLDAASGYPFLITFDQRGAAIERIELNGPRYHDLDDLSGYLGHLAPSNAPGGGCVIGAVGAGTPAAQAAGEGSTQGLQPGDRIVALNGEAIADRVAFERYLGKKTKPGQELEITLHRGEGDSAKKTFTAKLTRRPLELLRPESNEKGTSLQEDARFAKHGPPSFRLALRRLGDKQALLSDDELLSLPSLANRRWEPLESPDHEEIVFQTELTTDDLKEAELKNPLRITKRYRIERGGTESAKANYHVRLAVEIENLGEKTETTAYRIDGPNGLTSEGWWYSTKIHPEWFKGSGARDIAVNVDRHRLIGLPNVVSHADRQAREGNFLGFDLFGAGQEQRDVRYLAVDAQFFASALLADGAESQTDPAKHPTLQLAEAYALPLNKITEKTWSRTANVSFQATMKPIEIAPGAKHTDRFLIFAGPKSPETLERYGLSPLIEYGWFGWVSKTLLKVMAFLKQITGNYGISIILLTVIVRSGLLPFSIRQAKSAAVMQQLAPEMQKIKEKYADNMEKQSAELRELYRKYDFNPFGGCLLMFAQLPIFIGLYRCLSVDIELREAALIPGFAWCDNLAGPDQMFRWKETLWPIISDEGNGWFGPYCNLLPLFTIVLFLIQQKLFTPPPTDEQSEMQQKMMTFMTVFMGIMFYKVPAGLCIYFITSSLWGICERKMLPKAIPGSPPPPPEKKTESTASSLAGMLGLKAAEEPNDEAMRRKKKKKR